MIVSPNFSDILEPNIEIRKFPDGDSYVRIPDITKYAGKEAKVFHRLYPEQDRSIFQAVLILDTLKRAGVRPVLVSPYFPYSRQDKAFKEGEAMSAEVLCGMLKNADAEKIITIDCHFLKKTGKFEFGGLEIENLSANRLLVEHAKKAAGGEVEVVSPDMGASYLVSEFGGKSMKKERGEYAEGEEAYRKIEKMEREFDVSGKSILILDDMISTGGTMIKAVENIRKGGAKRIFCAATHGFFLKDSYKKLKDISDGVFVTDSIPGPASEVSMKPLLGL